MMKTNYKLKDLPADAQKHARLFRIHRFIDAASVGLFGVVILLIMQDRGFSLFEISILLAVFSGTGLVLELPLGGLADGIGRKPVFMLSVLAFLACIITLIIFDGFWLTMLSLIFMGVRMALMSGTLAAWFVEKFKILVPEHSTQPVLAGNLFAHGMGLAVASICGGLTADYVGNGLAHIGISKYEVPLIGCLILGVVVLLYTHFLIIETAHGLNKAALKKGFSNLSNIMSSAGLYGFKNKIISNMLVGAGCGAIAIFTFQSFWVPFVTPMLDEKFAATGIGILTFTYFFMSAMGAKISAPVIKLFNHKIGLALAVLTFICGLCLVGISTTTNLYVFTIILVVYTLFYGSIISPYQAIFHDNIPDDKRSTLLSLVSLMERLGGLVGLLFIGYIADVYGIAIAWKVGAVFLFIASLLYFSLQPRLNNIRNH